MQNSDDTLRVGTNEMELVDFRIQKKEGDRIYEGIYGVNVAKVREIIRLPQLTELPGVPEFVEGIFDLRGVVIPVVSLSKWMGVQPPDNVIKQTRVIIAEFNNILIGFIVHEAKRIRRISWNDIEPAAYTDGSGNMDKSKITGVTRIEDDTVLLILDLESVVEDLGLYSPSHEVEGEIAQYEGTVLVLDDSMTARRTVVRGLEEMGFKVVEAINGEDGLDKLNELYSMYEERFDKEVRLIVSDVEMPKMDGFHFAAKAKEDKRFARLPIIFNSSISDDFSENRGIEAGGESYLVKFDAPTFHAEVARVLNKVKEA